LSHLDYNKEKQEISPTALILNSFLFISNPGQEVEERDEGV
jgi:hypothetical protein